MIYTCILILYLFFTSVKA